VKTLYLSQRIPFPPNKGEKIRTFHQIKYLLDNNHEIFLCCPYTTDEELDLIEQFKDLYGVHTLQHKLGPNFLRYISGLISHKALSVSNFYNLKLQKMVDELILSESFRNIVCTSSSMAEYVFKSSAIAGKITKPKLVMDFMDLDSDKWKQYRDSSTLPMKWVYNREFKLLSKYEQNINRCFDICFFISQSEVDLFCKNNVCTVKPLAIGNGIDNEFFTPAIQMPYNNDPVFIFTGVMDYKPNIDSVLWFAENVWQKVIQKYPDSRFIIAGMNPVTEILALNNIKGIEVTGFVDDILPYYHQSDIFIAPLRIARGVQNKVLQAFSCGLPVIATSMGAEGIDYTDGTNILIADNPDSFFECIEQLVSNKLLYQSIKESALQLIKHNYSWDAQLTPLKNILE
jgi:sugar transferase (PEP-CTERM/EpsH1 system associated)